MKANIKDQWVRDLRSGDFLQGQSYLERVEDGQSYLCCLGVLCRQAVEAGAVPAPVKRGDDSYHYLEYLDDEYDTWKGNVTGQSFNQRHCLPRSVAEWAGVPYDRGGLNAGDIVIEHVQDDDEGCDFTAIHANDLDNLTFAEIADLIEQNVPAE